MRMRNLLLAVAGLALAATSLVPTASRACTAFSVASPEGRLLAKGFDWVTGAGWVVINERGRSRSLLLPGGGALDSWTSRYASLSLTTVGPGFPVSGMNEAGLAIEALVDVSATPSLSPEPGQLTGLEFLQYGLDRFATAAELADFAAAHPVSQLAVALHFLACDRGGTCVVVEPRRGGTRVTRTLAVPVLANRPYAEDLAAMRPSGLAAWLGLGHPARGSSADRVGTVARALSPAPPDESGSLALLERVVMPRRTQWQVVWNLTRGSLVLRQREAGLGTLTLRLSELDGPCSDAPRVRALGTSGATAFAPWSAGDDARVEGAILEQIGSAGPAARRLAAAVAAASRSSRCTSGR